MPEPTVAPEGGPVVLVVDDHRLVGSSLVLALGERGMTGVACPVVDIVEVLRTAEAVTPALALLDLELGVGTSGRPIDETELVVGLRARGCPVLIVSAETDERRIAAAIVAGAAGYVSKTAPLPELLDVVAAAAAGRRILSPEERERWVEIDREGRQTDRADRARLRRLTPREREVLERLADGDRAAAIAERFVVSLTTVRSQVRSILTKLEVNSQLEAVALARRIGTDASGRRHGHSDTT